MDTNPVIEMLGRTLALLFPNERDGASRVKFVEAAVASSHANGAWTDARLSSKERRHA